MKTEIKYIGQTKKDTWSCYAWVCNIGPHSFEYFTGLGHSTKSKNFSGLKPLHIKSKKTIREGDVFVHVPRLRDIIYSLALDARFTNDTFEDFCSNLGYDTDSRKALETYLKCQESGHKLRKILKSNNAIERIAAWEL